MQQLDPKKLSDEQLRDLENKTEEECAPGKRKAPTWVDPKTGLEWQYESPAEMTWYEALEYAKSLSLDGKNHLAFADCGGTGNATRSKHSL